MAVRYGRFAQKDILPLIDSPARCSSPARRSLRSRPHYHNALVTSTLEYRTIRLYNGRSVSRRNPLEYTAQSANLAHSIKYKKLWRDGQPHMRNYVIHRVGFMDNISLAKACGMRPEETELLYQFTWDFIRTNQRPIHVSEILRLHYITKGITSKYPENLQRVVARVNALLSSDNAKVASLEGLGAYPPQVLAKALRLIAVDAIEHVNDDDNGGRLLVWADRFFEIASQLGDSLAAVYMVQAQSRPDFQTMVQTLDLPDANTTQSRALITSVVTQNPKDCEWECFATYMSMEFDVTNLRRRDNKTLNWAIAWLEDRIATGSFVTQSNPTVFPVYHSPFKYLLRIVDFCLHENVNLKQYPRDKLNDIREWAIQELVGISDPEACFISAIRQGDFSSSHFLRLMQEAAKGGIDHACWLLAIHEWNRSDLLSTHGPTQKSISGQITQDQRLGFEYAMHATLGSALDGPFVNHKIPWFWRRAVTTAAVLRRMMLPSDSLATQAGLEWLTLMHKLGERVERPLPDMSVMLDRLLISQQAYVETGTPAAEGKAGMWTDELMKQLISNNTNPDVLIKDLQDIVR